MIKATCAALTGIALIASLSANVALTAALVKERVESATYSLIGLTPDGNSYVMDSGLSWDDCRTSPLIGYPVQICEREGSN